MPGACAAITRRAALTLVLAAATATNVHAVLSGLTPSDIQRAVALARWPRTNADWQRFQQRYVFPVKGEVVDAWSVEQIEVITEFRRAALMAQQHARLNDSWGRGGIGEVEDAMRPWRGRLTIAVSLHLTPTLLYVASVPEVEVRVGDSGAAPVISYRRTELCSSSGADSGCAVTGGQVDADFDTATIGQAKRVITVLWKDRQLARVAIDFASLE